MPQIELMQGDLPHTLYGRRGGAGTTVTEDVVRKQEEANRRAEERHRRMKEARGWTVDELFRGDAD